MPISQRNQNVKKQYCKKFNKDRKKKKKLRREVLMFLRAFYIEDALRTVSGRQCQPQQNEALNLRPGAKAGGETGCSLEDHRRGFQEL